MYYLLQGNGEVIIGKVRKIITDVRGRQLQICLEELILKEVGIILPQHMIKRLLNGISQYLLSLVRCHTFS